MSHKARLQAFSDEVVKVGRAGKPMQDELRKVASREDLTAEQIRRVAEMSNRAAQTEINRSATDKRATFKLCDADSLIKELRKDSKTASVVEATATGDESDFNPPEIPREDPVKLSLYAAAPQASTQVDDAEALYHTLDRTRRELEVMHKEAASQVMAVYHDATGSHKEMIDAACDMVQAGITLPSLYQAVSAAVSGSDCTDGERQKSDAIMLMVVKGLKERGVPNHKMGFRHPGDVNAINALSPEDLLALVKNAMGGMNDAGISLKTQKTAQRYLESVPVEHLAPKNQHPYEEAGKWLNQRGAIADFALPQIYTDDNQTNNIPERGIRAINGDSEFVVAVKDLVGDQNRMGKAHNAQEYMGLKLKEIAEAMSKLSEGRAKAAAIAAMPKPSEKAAFIGALLGGASRLAAGVMASPVGAKAVGLLNHPVTHAATALHGVVGALKPAGSHSSPPAPAPTPAATSSRDMAAGMVAAAPYSAM